MTTPDQEQPVAGELPERDASKPAEQQGLFRKFNVNRTDGSSAPGGKHHRCEYFVLDVNHDQHAKAALAAYAESVRQSHPLLAEDMIERYGLLAASPAPTLAEPLLDYHCTIKCSACGHKNYFTRRELEADAAPPEPQSEREAAQRERMAATFANRPTTAATVDFDLPAPNDAIAVEPQQTEQGEYPPLPQPAYLGGMDPDGWSADQMRAYVDADRARQASQPLTQAQIDAIAAAARKIRIAAEAARPAAVRQVWRCASCGSEGDDAEPVELSDDDIIDLLGGDDGEGEAASWQFDREELVRAARIILDAAGVG